MRKGRTKVKIQIKCIKENEVLSIFGDVQGNQIPIHIQEKKGGHEVYVLRNCEEYSDLDGLRVWV